MNVKALYKDGADFWVQLGAKCTQNAPNFASFTSPKSSRNSQHSDFNPGDYSMIVDHTPEPLWINEPDWLGAFEFLNDEDPEGRDLAADTIGYLLGYAHLTNTRTVALIGDPDAMAYEILFSFSSPVEKKRFLDLIRSNDDLGNEYVENDLILPVRDEIRAARPVAKVLPPLALTRALLVATTVCSSTSENPAQ
jgi:hypothetical protein